MNSEEKLRLKQKQMPNNELIERATSEVFRLCETGGKSLTMSVPPMITDTDLILCEVIRRFEELVKEN